MREVKECTESALATRAIGARTPTGPGCKNLGVATSVQLQGLSLCSPETLSASFKLDTLQNYALAKELVCFSNFGGGIVLLGQEDDGSRSGLTRANIEEWVMTTCRDQAPRGGARRGLCEGRHRGRIGRRNGDHRMIQKGTYGSSFRLRCYPFPEGKIDPERPQRRGDRSVTSDPLGAKNRRFLGGRSGLFGWPRLVQKPQ